MIDIDYQAIYESIAGTLPNDWEKVVLNCRYFVESFEIIYYVKRNALDYKDCYSLFDSDKEMNDVMMKLCHYFIGKKHEWNSLTITFSSNGDFVAEPEYSDFSDNYDLFIEEWRLKYLK